MFTLLHQLSAKQTQTSSLPAPPFLTPCSSRWEKIKKQKKKSRIKKKKKTKIEKNVDAVASVGDAASCRLPATETTVLSDTLKITINLQPNYNSWVNYRWTGLPFNPPGASSERDSWETLSKSVPLRSQICLFFLRFFSLFFPSSSFFTWVKSDRFP